MIIIICVCCILAQHTALRRLFSPELLELPGVRLIEMRDVAKTKLRQAMERTLYLATAAAVAAGTIKPRTLSKTTIEEFALASHGDVRHAVMSLQLVCDAGSSKLVTKRAKVQEQRAEKRGSSSSGSAVSFDCFVLHMTEYFTNLMV